ncbi:MAG: FG-GAP repeat protein [Chromatiales bacterium]|nr:FG-GAP repeat protein [Chromatiales bacterium]
METISHQVALMDTSIVATTLFKLARITVFATLVILLFACGSGNSDSDQNQDNPQQFRVGVTVNDLNGGTLVVQNSNQDTLDISEDGNYTFPTPLNDADSYHVTITTQPANQTCRVDNATGVIAGSDVSDPVVSCHAIDYRIGGLVTGLTGSGLVLQNNGSDDLNITANGDFSFPTLLEPGNDFLVTIATQPSGQTCSVVNGSGTLNDRELTQVVISCPLDAVTPEVQGVNPKTLRFSWNDVGADYYRLLKNPDGQTGYTQVGNEITDTIVDETIAIHLTDWNNASYLIQACNGADLCSDSPPLSISSAMIHIIGYLKADDMEREFFGGHMALSNDGTTLAVSSSAGIHIFINEDTQWQQQTVIDTPYTAFSLSGDGTTLAAAYSDDEGAITETDGGGGAVRVFTRDSDSWSYQAYLKSSISNTNDHFGQAVALSDDGNTLAISAYREDSAATGVNGDQTDNSSLDSGAAYVFKRVDNIWRQQAYIKASNTDTDDRFGTSLALSADGSTLAVGAPGEQSAATGVNGDQSNNNAIRAGAVYLFNSDEGEWTQQAYIKASNAEARDAFGNQVALSGDGDLLAVSATLEDSSATGIDGDQTDNSVEDSGAIYLFERQANNNWTQTAYIKASNPDPSDVLGRALALSDDGTILAVGTALEDSIARGINGDQSDNSSSRAGAVYIFTVNNGSWRQQAYVKASNTRAARVCPIYGQAPCPPQNASFGISLALSQDGSLLTVGAPTEYSPNPAYEPIDAPFRLGAVYLY